MLKKGPSTMKITKKINSSIALLLLIVTFNSYNMDSRLFRWAGIVGNVLLEMVTVQTLFGSPIEPFAFTSLPKDMQNNIIQLLSIYATATSLESAAFTINSLAQVNKELNELINEPQFCLKIIKHLAIKFKCSDQEVAEALQTQEAKRRLKIQNQLFNTFFPEAEPHAYSIFFSKTKPHETRPEFIPNISQLMDIRNSNDDFDYNFTYKTTIPTVFGTILMCLAKRNNAYLLKFFISIGKGKINMNQSNLQGETALILLCFQMTVKRNPAAIDILLNAGADPEFAPAGITPLDLVQRVGDQNAIKLIQKAIEKKYEKK